MTITPGLFAQAVGPIADDDLRCPACGAMNRVGIKPYVERQPNLDLVCSVCGKTSRPRPQ